MRGMTRMATAGLVLGALAGAVPVAAQTSAEARVRMEAVEAARAGLSVRLVARSAEGAREGLAHLESLEGLRDLGALAGVRAPAAWLQEDPGSGLYTEAREHLNRRRYREAATAFASLRERFPRSGYVGDSYYWQAFALYREGGRDNYRRALELLTVQGERFREARTRSDADELRVRVEAQLARRGDADAAANIAQQAAGPCNGDQELRAAALSALLNMNADQAVPILREVLQDRDECAVELRRRAVFLVSQKMNEESVDLLLDLAHRNPDPDAEVREQAVFWLSQVRSDEALDALASILRETSDPALQEKAVFAISQHRSERGLSMLRDYAERADGDPEVRANAIFWIGQSDRAGGPRYLRELYPRLSDPELKERVIFGVSQSRDAENQRWLLERARDRSEPLEIRKNALFWAGQSGAVDGASLRDLYASFEDREMKEQIIFVASQRNREAAVDFLMEVARTEQDTELQRKAVFWLGQSKDPRVAEFLLELIRR